MMYSPKKEEAYIYEQH